MIPKLLNVIAEVFVHLLVALCYVLGRLTSPTPMTNRTISVTISTILVTSLLLEKHVKSLGSRIPYKHKRPPLNNLNDVNCKLAIIVHFCIRVLVSKQHGMSPRYAMTPFFFADQITKHAQYLASSSPKRF